MWFREGHLHRDVLDQWLDEQDQENQAECERQVCKTHHDALHRDGCPGYPDCDTPKSCSAVGR